MVLLYIFAISTLLWAKGNTCFFIAIEPNQTEIEWKTNVTLVCNCSCDGCYDDKNKEYRSIEVTVTSSTSSQAEYLADMEMDESVGRYTFPDVTQALYDGKKYRCFASRVGNTPQIGFNVVEPPPVITTFNRSSADEAVTSTTVMLTWVVPTSQPPTRHFTILVQDTVEGKTNRMTIHNGSQTECVVRDLVPARRYKFSIANFNKIGFKEYSKPVTVTTLEDKPSASPPDLVAQSREPGQLQLLWGEIPQAKRNGEITEYEFHCVYQCYVNCTNKKLLEYKNTTSEQFYLLTGVKENAQFSCKARAFTRVGGGPWTNPVVVSVKEQPKVTIRPLPDTAIQPTTTVDGGKKQTSTLIIAIVVAIVFVAALTVAVYLYRDRIGRIFTGSHTRLKTEDSDSPMIPGNYGNNLSVPVDPTIGNEVIGKSYQTVELPPDIPPKSVKPPIHNVDFPTHVEELHANGNAGFNREYHSINPGGGWSCEVGANNKNKNRYYNVKCYDHTRVKLQRGGASDYINANFVDGYNKKKAYIATQGPLPHTSLDFWMMVWEQKSNVVVMVTNLVELARVKCYQYFPDSGSLTLGPVTVTLLESTPLADFTIRTLKIELDKEEMQVKHFHFTSWPDHGVPPFSNAILSFVRHVRNVKLPDSGPVVVHCSAGVGRTGTFMAIDSMLDMSEKEECVDIFGYVTLMRTCRPSMVQTEDQYIFIHDAILEALTCGVTEVRAKDLSDHFEWLLDTDSFTNNVRINDEYERLGYNIRDLSHQMTTAQSDQNASKNRNKRYIPYDQGRVWLFPLPQQPFSNYINASHIDGFRARKAFIATQSPLPNTIDDFWRMIWEMHSSTVVMLNKEDETEPYFPYFPLEGSADFGNMRVEFKRKEEHRDYVLTILLIFNKEEGLSRSITHFQYNGWPEDRYPASYSTLLEMISKVNKCQQSCASKFPVVVHCDYGMGRTGAFLALCICLDRMKVENVVDVFQTVRTMRSQRPAMVNSTSLYKFIFLCLVEYLQKLDLYANFK